MVIWPRLRFIGPNEKPPRWQRASKKIQSFDQYHRQVVGLDYLLFIEVIHLLGGLCSPTGATQLGRPFENVIDLDWTQVIGAQVAHGMKLWMSLYLFNWKTTRSTSTNALLLCSWIRWSKKCNAASKITLQCHKNLSNWKHSPQRTKISKLLHFTMTEHIHISRRPFSIEIDIIALII